MTDRAGPSQVEEDAYVIRHRIDEDRRAFQILQDGGEVGVQGATDRIVDQRGALPGAEYQVRVQARQGLRHGCSFLSRLRFNRPFRADVEGCPSPQGVALGCLQDAPLALLAYRPDGRRL